MLDNTLEIVFVTGFVAGALIRAFWLKRTPHWWRDEQEIADDRARKLDRPLLALNFLGMQVLPLVYVLTDWLDFADYRLPVGASLAAGSVGATIFVLALWLLWRSHADLGRDFSPQLQLREGHSLVTQGVFQHIRHPMYAAHLLWAVAQLLLLQNWIAGPAFLVASIPLYIARIPREEEMMEDEFGEEYRRYMERTGRVVPRIPWDVAAKAKHSATAAIVILCFGLLISSGCLILVGVWRNNFTAAGLLGDIIGALILALNSMLGTYDGGVIGLPRRTKLKNFLINNSFAFLGMYLIIIGFLLQFYSTLR
jgi:protein-S-isoprenylcysteine O-methyltransferase Ste14